MILSFDEFTVDTDAFELRFNQDIRKVEPMVFDLIAHFASHPERIFTHEELIKDVWQGRIVSDSTVATCVKNVRRALGDTGATQRYVQTVRGRGYRFSAKVSRTDAQGDNESNPVLSSSASADPSILILPFRCLSDDLEIRRIVDGLGADLGAILTRIPLLRFSTEAGHYEGRDVPPTARQVHEDLGVDFVLDGSLQETGGDIRVNVQLSDAKTAYRLWAESFRLGEPLANGLDQCIGAIVGKLEPQLHRAMYDAVHATGGELTARQLFLEASGILVMRGWNHESFTEAGAILHRSAGMDPHFALAPALLSLLYGFGARIGLATDLETAKAEALRTAEQALKLDSMNSIVLGLTGCSLADIGEAERGEPLLLNAIDLNPANAQAWVALGTLRLAQGDYADAITKLSKGIDMSPVDSRLSVWGALLAGALLQVGDANGACDAAETACRRHDRTYLPRVALAGARVAQNNDDRALRALTDARRIKPDLTREQIEAIVDTEICDRLLALTDT